jgi:hypothetical protein
MNLLRISYEKLPRAMLTYRLGSREEALSMLPNPE